MTAWTPGPWFAHGKLGKSLQYGVTAGKPYDQSIGAVRRIAKCGSPYPSRTKELDTEDCANARLIAAAPDMAEALVEAILVLNALITEGESLYGPRALMLAHAALKKAHGEP